MRYKTAWTFSILNLFFLSIWFAGHGANLTKENGVLEVLQVLAAAGACAVFAFAALEDSGPVGSSGTAMTATSGIAVLREIDVRDHQVPEWMLIWAYGPFRDTAVTIMLVLVLIYLWYQRAHFNGWVQLALRRQAWPLWLGGILVMSSLALDGGKIIGGQFGVFVEELVELNGFLLLLVAAWRHSHLLTRRAIQII